MKDSKKLEKVHIHMLIIIIGSYGSVYKIKRISDGKTLVWKELDYRRMNERER